MNRIAILILTALSLALAPSLGCASKPSTDPVKQAELQTKLLAELPPPARLAIERETTGGVVTSTETDEYLGRTVYTADFTSADGRRGEVQVTSDGRVLSNHIEVAYLDFKDVPERVQTVILAKTGGIAPDEVTHETRGSIDVYGFVIDLAEVPHSFIFDHTGSLISESVGINARQLPPAVVSSLGTRFGGIAVSDIDEVRERGTITYRIIGVHQNRNVTITFLPDGTVQSVRARNS